jgi:plastocyanin
MGPRGTRWATVLLGAGLAIAGGLAGSAQDATPGGAAHAHPAHIHLGSCTELDPNPTYMLTDVALLPGAEDASGGNAAAVPVERSVTTVEDTLENLSTGGYAINIHQSVDDIGTYIACGNLTGAIDPDGPLVVGLGELNDSGHSGIAILTTNGDQTDVNVYLAEGLSGAVAAAAESAAATDDAAATADATMVDIKDFAYDPAAIEIPVGSTVTWTNSDTVPHTVTAFDRAALQSGTLDGGATFSQTFEAPGTIDYFCEFHADMKGSLVIQ